MLPDTLYLQQGLVKWKYGAPLVDNIDIYVCVGGPALSATFLSIYLTNLNISWLWPSCNRHKTYIIYTSLYILANLQNCKRCINKPWPIAIFLKKYQSWPSCNKDILETPFASVENILSATISIHTCMCHLHTIIVRGCITAWNLFA